MFSDDNSGRPRIRTRNDLMALIGASLKSFLPHLDDERALSTANHILRSMRTAGLRIRQARGDEKLGGQSGVPWREVAENSRLPAGGPNRTTYGTDLAGVKDSGYPLWATCENGQCDQRMKGIPLNTDDVIKRYGGECEAAAVPMKCKGCGKRLKVSTGSKAR